MKCGMMFALLVVLSVTAAMHVQAAPSNSSQLTKQTAERDIRDTSLSFFLQDEMSDNSIAEMQKLFDTTDPNCNKPDNRSPCDPKFEGTATESQKALIKDIHRAAFHFVKAALQEVDNNRDHFKKLFGTPDAARLKIVKDTFKLVLRLLSNSVIKYRVPSKLKLDYYCKNSDKTYSVAISLWHINEITFCPRFFELRDLVTAKYFGSKIYIIIHEWIHLVRTNTYRPELYGSHMCSSLAEIQNPSPSSSPEQPARDASNTPDCYGYFAATVNIFDYGFDSIAVLPDGKTYATKGNMFLRYSDSGANTIDSGYPALIRGHWGTLTEEFYAGFDSMAVLPEGNIYVTKGAKFMRYSDKSASTADFTTPAPLKQKWGNTNSLGKFEDGFDSMSVLANHKLYVTKEKVYLQYSDYRQGSTDAKDIVIETAKFLNSNYDRFPPQVGRAYSDWGTLPHSFQQGFDAVVALKNGKVCVTKGKEYIRYSDTTIKTIESGFPRPIKGNWGTIEFELYTP